MFIDRAICVHTAISDISITFLHVNRANRIEQFSNQSQDGSDKNENKNY